ncbi:MAG: hypothetical protein J0665_10780 [Deltaproteobacteria bacterium]|nr:hypothetical protein [Deltaproteobacteria bacterium]
MTWMERFEETMKAPAIATPNWFECIPFAQRDEAHRLVAMGASVCVMPAIGGGSTVLFDDTDFVAGVFQEATVAERFAAAWNRR